MSVFKSEVLVLLSLAVCARLIAGSAIPMWEFLSRGEKMSHLYSMFAKEVEQHCEHRTEFPEASVCRRELLSYGLAKLQSMSELHLDSMDPYQRGAIDIIWDSMMQGHATTKSKPVTTEAPATADIIRSGAYGHNPLFDGPSPTFNRRYTNDQYSSYAPAAVDEDFKGAHNYLGQNHEEASSNVNEQYAFSTGLNTATLEQNWLPVPGPMVVRLRPDGTPVDEDRNKPLPKDEDREEYSFLRRRLPTLEQIAASFRAPTRRSLQ